MYFITDIDECATNRDDCSVNADCINTDGSFQCRCRSGFEGDGRVCRGMWLSFAFLNQHKLFMFVFYITTEDVNECIEQTDNCHTFATCINLEGGGFECRCLEGYEGNGLQCSGKVWHALFYVIGNCGYINLQTLMSVLGVQITVTQMLTVSILKVASSVCAGQDMKEVEEYAQVQTALQFL